MPRFHGTQFDRNVILHTRAMANDKTQLLELKQFLLPTFQIEIKGIALEYVAGLTASDKGCRLIVSTDNLVESLIRLLVEDDNEDIKRECLKILINISPDPENTKQLGLLDEDFLFFLIKYVLNHDAKYADDGAKLLSNMTRCEGNCKTVLNYIESLKSVKLPDFVDAFCIRDYNKKGNQLSYLGSFLSNLTMLDNARRLFLDKERCVIQRLLPYTTHMDSKVRRAAAVRIIKNVSFETEHHEWLLDADFDVLSHLLLPLAGPEELPEDEMDQLPIDLQYLPAEKEREPDADIRLMLIETLLQFCARKYGREKLKGNGVYLVIRELHKVEKVDRVETVIEKLIHILIGDEPEESMENLRQVEIPEDIQKRFTEIDATLESQTGS